MRKNQKKRGVSWTRMVLLVAALLMLGMMMYFLQKTAVMSEEGTTVQTVNATQKVNTDPNKNQQLRAEGMNKAGGKLADKSVAGQRPQSVNTRANPAVNNANRREQVLDIVKKEDEKDLMKRKEAEYAKNKAEMGKRPASLTATDRKKTQAQKTNSITSVGKQQPQGEAIEGLLIILEMFEKKNQILLTEFLQITKISSNILWAVLCCCC